VSAHTHEHGHSHGHAHSDGEHGHGHSHGLVHASIKRSKAGLRAVSLSLAILLLTALAQGAVFVATSSVALLADLIHNFGDALTALPLGVAFVLRSFRAEKRAGYFVVATIFVSACVAAGEAINRLINPQTIHHLPTLAAAGIIGFIGNEIAAQIRLRAGHNLNSPALVADGNHARTDGYVSLAVVASAAVVALGLNVADPLIGLAITLVILRITWQSFQTVRDDPGEHDTHAHHAPHAPPDAVTADPQ
jgi:cation diffusion facilitator family transporter